MTFLRTVRLPILIALLLTAQTALAQFDPLAPIPGVTADGGDIGLVGYIQRFFYLAIFIGGILAVIRITMAGVKYMFTDVVSSKSEARSDILGAFMGIGILLVSVLVLTRINPDLLNLDVLRNATPVELDEATKRSGKVIVPGEKECDTLAECEAYRDNVLKGAYKKDGSGGCPEGFTAKAEDPWGLTAGRAWCDDTTTVKNEAHRVVELNSDTFKDWYDISDTERRGIIEEAAGKVNKLVEDCEKIDGFTATLKISPEINVEKSEDLDKARWSVFRFSCEFNT